MSAALARRASRRAFERAIASDVARAGAVASNVQRARDFSVQAKTDVPPPPITANAAGTGGRSSFRFGARAEPLDETVDTTRTKVTALDAGSELTETRWTTRSGITCTVFGATGFLGRYVTHHVAKSGSRMILPTRCGENDRQHLKVMGDLGQIVQMDYAIRDEGAIRHAVERSNVVINLIGREWETRNFSFEDVNVTFPKKLAEICADVGVRRLIHVSALGAELDHPSAYYRTKARGEEVVREAFPSATIVRPARMVGVEDRFLNVFAEHSRKYPAVPIIDGGDSKHQPVFVDDVAVAIRQIVYDELTSGRTYELAGKKVYTVDDLAKLVLRTARSRRSTAYVPSFIMKALSCPHEWLLRKVPFPMPTPVGLTRSYIDAQTRDYIKAEDTLGFSDLGMEPNNIENGYVLDYLRSYRAGGYALGEAPWENDKASA